MNRKKANDGIIVVTLIALIVLSSGSGELETEDKEWMNNTYLLITNYTHNIIPTQPQYTENFESQYRGSRTEDMDLLTVSEIWNGGIGTGTSFTLELPETPNHEWQTSTIALLNDTNTSDYIACYRNGLLGYVDGSADNNDWWQTEFYNATGTGLAGCIITLGGETGNPVALVIINGDTIYAYDNITPRVIGENTQGVWHTVRIKTKMPNLYNVTINGIEYGEYETYLGNNWDWDSDGFSTGLNGGYSTAGGVSDTCTMWVDNITDSWSTTEKIVFNATSNLFDDKPVFKIDIGADAQFYLPSILTYSEQGEEGVCVNDLGGLGTCVGGGVPNHNDLSGLQGGTTGEYYHLTSSQHSELGSYNLTYHNTNQWVLGNATTWLSTFNQTYHDAWSWILGNATIWSSIFNQTYHDGVQWILGNDTAWKSTYNATYQAGLIPSGMIAFFINQGGTGCPTGWTRVSGLDGVYLIGATAGNDGGDTIAGTTTLPNHAHTTDPDSFTSGVSSNTSHTHQYTQVPNHVHVQNFPSGFTGSQAYLATDTSTTGSTASAISTANPTGGVATGQTQLNNTDHTHSIDVPSTTSSNPTTNPSITPPGYSMVACSKD